MADNDDLNPFQGWVSVHEIRSVCIEYLRKAEYDIFPDGEHWRGPKLRVLKLLETMQHELYAKARRNWQDFLIRERPKAKDLKAELPQVDSKEAFEKRKADIRSRQ